MTEFDITKAGLMVGLEIHQQLGRPGDKKLFCDCPADMVERQPDKIVTRSLRASAGEAGEIDAAAAAEQSKGKIYVYNYYNDVNCLVELDEEPPHPANNEAITTAVMVAKACGSEILRQVQFMRKTIVDGSAVSGFQRTGLLAMGGVVPGVEQKVRVQTICVEEDAAKIISRTVSSDNYNLSRLGIPLVELATEPDITTPLQAQEVAGAIGMLLRSTRRVKRGLGTIRQDVNVSIAGGNRVEIKGAQDLRMISTIVEYEAKRQHSLLAVRDHLSEKGISLSEITIKGLMDVTSSFSSSSVGFIKGAIAKGDKALGMKLKELSGTIGTELCPNYRVGSELADLARAFGFGGLIHSDEDMKKYGVDKSALAELFSCTKDDAFVILIGNENKIMQVIDAMILPRIKQLAVGVPKEVRRANPDGTTGFLRHMPGAARMYPETDIPVVAVDSTAISAPKLIKDQISEMVKRYRISEDHAKDIVREGLPFEDLVAKHPAIEPSFISGAIVGFGKDIQTRYKKEIDHIPLLDPLLAAVERRKISKGAVFEILVEIAEGKVSIDRIDYAKYAEMPESDLVKIVREVIRNNPSGSIGAMMGVVMAKARGKADGKKVMAFLETERKNAL